MANEKAKRRLWLVFFLKRVGRWYDPLLGSGFANVAMCSYHADLDVWLVVRPRWFGGAVVEIFRDTEAFNAPFGEMVMRSSVVLRMPSAKRVGTLVRGGWCVSVVKSLLGFRSRALTPKQLCEHLLVAGAEVAKVPTRAEIEAATARQRGATSDVHVLH